MILGDLGGESLFFCLEGFSGGLPLFTRFLGCSGGLLLRVCPCCRGFSLGLEVVMNLVGTCAVWFGGFGWFSILNPGWIFGISEKSGFKIEISGVGALILRVWGLMIEKL